MKKIILVLPIVVLTTIPVLAQMTPAECDSIFNFYSEIWEENIGVILFEKAPELIGNDDQLITTVLKEGSIKNETKIYIHFIVDKEGNPQCVEPIKGGNEFLRKHAVEHVERLKFSPATQKGNPLMAPMILPIRVKVDSTSNRKHN